MLLGQINRREGDVAGPDAQVGMTEKPLESQHVAPARR